MKIAVYPGSFNPLHIGHQAILEYLTVKKDFDWVYLIVSPKNPVKDTVSAKTARERYEAAVAAVKRHPELHVWVDDIELTMPPPQYTIRTLDALKRREPENDFTLIIGADNLDGLHAWRDFPRILTDYGVAVFPRKGSDAGQTRAKLLEECRLAPSPYGHDADGIFDRQEGGFENLLEHMYHIEILEAQMVDMSSTEIRAGLAAGEDMSAYLM